MYETLESLVIKIRKLCTGIRIYLAFHDTIKANFLELFQASSKIRMFKNCQYREESKKMMIEVQQDYETSVMTWR